MAEYPAWLDDHSEAMEWAAGHIPDRRQRRAFEDWVTAWAKPDPVVLYPRLLKLLLRPRRGRYSYLDDVLKPLPERKSPQWRAILHAFRGLDRTLVGFQSEIRALRKNYEGKS